VGGAGAALAAAALAGCGDKPLRIKIRGGAKVSPADVDALNALLEVEQYAVAAYTASIPLLNWREAKPPKQFLGQELAHTVELTDLIMRARGKPVKPKAHYDLGQPRSADDALALLKRSEEAQLQAYLSTLPRLSGGRLRSTVAAIYSNEAQHLAFVRTQLGQSPVPAAFAVG
jgi:hypothetical protein